MSKRCVMGKIVANPGLIIQGYFPNEMGFCEMGNRMPVGIKSHVKELEIAQKFYRFLDTLVLTGSQAENLALFMTQLRPEARMVIWAAVQSKMENVVRVHPFMSWMIVPTQGKIPEVQTKH